MTAPTLKTNHDRSAVVNQAHYWISIHDHGPPPIGPKLLLINKSYGVAQVGAFDGSPWWTHWQGLPKFKEARE